MKLIAFTGNMGSGKSTAIECIKELQHNIVFVNKFADPLYEIQEEIYNVLKPVYTRSKNFIKDRKLLQWIGTEWGRSIDPNIWVNLWKYRIEGFKANMEVRELSKKYYIITCDDCRFDNEAEAVKSLGGIIIKITSKKSDLRIDTKSGIANHVSEAGIKMDYVDAVVENDGSIEDLKEALLTLNQLKHIW